MICPLGNDYWNSLIWKPKQTKPKKQPKQKKNYQFQYTLNDDDGKYTENRFFSLVALLYVQHKTTSGQQQYGGSKLNTKNALIQHLSLVTGKILVNTVNAGLNYDFIVILD